MNTTATFSSRRPTRQGLALIEVIVALAILGILLGITSELTRSLADAQQSMQIVQAVTVDIETRTETLRATPYDELLKQLGRREDVIELPQGRYRLTVSIAEESPETGGLLRIGLRAEILDIGAAQRGGAEIELMRARRQWPR